MPVSMPFFSAVSSAASEVPARRHSSQKASTSGLVAAACLASGWSAAIARKEAPKSVSGWVV
ncbi:hypothetical protein D9M70_433800 [compost metagenome]